mgnify:CR=1 FL=1
MLAQRGLLHECQKMGARPRGGRSRARNAAYVPRLGEITEREKVRAPGVNQRSSVVQVECEHPGKCESRFVRVAAVECGAPERAVKLHHPDRSVLRVGMNFASLEKLLDEESDIARYCSLARYYGF